MTKDEVADALDEIGTLLELKGENAFRCNAYHNGARTVRQLDADLKELVAQDRLGEARGIGDALREKITTLVRTGSLPYLENLRTEVPAGFLELLRLPGLGAKKIRALHDGLGVDSIVGIRFDDLTAQPPKSVRRPQSIARWERARMNRLLSLRVAMHHAVRCAEVQARFGWRYPASIEHGDRSNHEAKRPCPIGP